MFDIVLRDGPFIFSVVVGNLVDPTTLQNYLWSETISIDENGNITRIA